MLEMSLGAGLTIIGTAIVVTAGIVKALEVFRPKDEAHLDRIKHLEDEVAAQADHINNLDKRLIQVETHIEGIDEIKDSVKTLDKKIDKLTTMLIEWVGKK